MNQVPAQPDTVRRAGSRPNHREPCRSAPGRVAASCLADPSGWRRLVKPRPAGGTPGQGARRAKALLVRCWKTSSVSAFGASVVKFQVRPADEMRRVFFR
jgi:hypothetical protein